MKKASRLSKVFVLMLVTALFVSCGSAKKTTIARVESDESISVVADNSQTSDYSGNYNWVVTGIPDGDQAGSMSLKKTETGYTGELEAMGMAVPIDEITMDGNKMSGYIPVQDIDLGFTIVFEGNGFKGNLFAMGEAFPFIGKKQK